MDGMCLVKDHMVQNPGRARVRLAVHLLTCFDWCDLCLSGRNLLGLETTTLIIIN